MAYAKASEMPKLKMGNQFGYVTQMDVEYDIGYMHTFDSESVIAPIRTGPGMVNFSVTAPATDEIIRYVQKWMYGQSAEFALPTWANEWMCLYCGSPQSLKRTHCSQCGAPRSWIL